MEQFSLADPVALLSIGFSMILLVLLLVIYFAKERSENRRLEKMQSDQLNQSFSYSETQVASSEQKPKKASKSSRIITNVSGTRVKLTPSLLEALRSLDNSSWWIKAMIKKLIPEDQLNELIEKALKGELEAGMVVMLKDGRIILEKDKPAD